MKSAKNDRLLVSISKMDFSYMNLQQNKKITVNPVLSNCQKKVPILTNP